MFTYIRLHMRWSSCLLSLTLPATCFCRGSLLVIKYCVACHMLFEQEVHKRDRPASLCRYGRPGQEAAERNKFSVEMLC